MTFSLFIFPLLACSAGNDTSSGDSSYKTDCQTDSDCVLVDKDCCGCVSGGDSIAIHKSQENIYNKDLQSRCAAAVDSSKACATWDRCAEFQAQCRNSKCISINKTEASQ